MGILGIGKGIAKIINGIISDEPEEIIKGVKKTGKNIVTTIFVNKMEERIVNDDDESD